MGFPYILARDNETFTIWVVPHICDYDPSCGIMSEYVDDVTITDLDDRPAQVTDKEYAEILDFANERVADDRGAELDDIL